MACYFTQYTMTATAASISSIFSTAIQDVHVTKLELKAKATNTAAVYGGGSGVTNVPANAGFALDHGEGFSLQSSGNAHQVDIGKVYVVGTVGDILFITAVA